MTGPWLLLQLADSAFPVGGFAHSAGLEAAMQSGWVRDGKSIESFCADAVRQAGAFSLPFVVAAHRGRDPRTELDARCDVMLSNAVANRASRLQGRAHLDACARVFDEHAGLRALREEARASKGHHAPVFGASLAALGVVEADCVRLFLHASLRGVTSAAVRLGALGPAEAQRLCSALHPVLEDVAACAHGEVERAAQISPLADLLQGAHDRLYSRLFQS
jgi:urease accessory protein